jgi:hypothetical protein
VGGKFTTRKEIKKYPILPALPVISDLHGDGRVHPPVVNPEGPSGYGFELTFRLKRFLAFFSPSYSLSVSTLITLISSPILIN